MKKWIQVFIDEKDSEESIPMRIDTDQIRGFKKFGTSQTIIFTTIGTYTVCEEYVHFSNRLFNYVNGSNENEETTAIPVVAEPAKKRIIIKRKSQQEINKELLEDYYDTNQPETNC